MKQTLNLRQQHSINLRYCYSSRRATQGTGMSAMGNSPTIGLISYLQDEAILNSHSLTHFTKKQKNVQAFVNLHIRPVILSVDNTFFKKTLLDFIFS